MTMDFSIGCACVSHASDVLGACVMITSALHRLNAGEREKHTTLSRPAGFLSGLAWGHHIRSPHGHTTGNEVVNTKRSIVGPIQCTEAWSKRAFCQAVLTA